MHKVLEQILDYQVINENIGMQEKETYKYAYTILIEGCINLILAIIIGIIFDKIILVIIFLGIYIPLRMFAGGYHADSGIRCCLVSTIILIVLCISHNMIAGKGNYIFTGMLSIGGQIGIYWLSPIDTATKRLSSNEKETHKKNVGKILSIHFLTVIFGIIIKNEMMIWGITYAHVVLIGMLLVGNYKNIRKKEVIDKMKK